MGETIETIHVRGEGGAVWEMDLPLREDAAKRLAKGLLVRVNPDGSTYQADPVDPEVVVDEDLDDEDDDSDDDTPPELAAFLDTPPDPVTAKKATPAKKTTTAK